MKHVFILNPMAGSGKQAEALREKIRALPCEYELYETTEHRDATRFVRAYCETHGGPIRFYACGGDGTIKEVAEGMLGRKDVSLSVCPIGSGNDFVKIFGGAELFSEPKNLIGAPAHPIDVIRVSGDGIEDTYSVNVVNFGFEASVAGKMNDVRRKPLIGGKNAYTTGILISLFTAMHNHAEVYADGEKINPDGSFLLCTLANGGYVGGAYHCAPRASVNDGLLELCLVKPVSVLSFANLIGAYKNGTHLEDPRFKDIMTYRRAKKVEVVFKKPELLCLDGEMLRTAHFTAEAAREAICFAAPELPQSADAETENAAPANV